MQETRSQIQELLSIDCSPYLHMTLSWTRYDSMRECALQRSSYSFFTERSKNTRAEALSELCEELRKQTGGSYHSLNTVVLCLGPGSFSGTRSSLSFAKGLCAALPHCKLVGISSHRLVAECYPGLRPLLVLTDARSSHLFHSLYRRAEHDEAGSEPEIYDQPYEVLLQQLPAMLTEQKPVYCAGPEAQRVYTLLQDSGMADGRVLLPQCPWEHMQSIEVLTAFGIQQAKKGAFTSLHCSPIYVRKEVENT